MYTEVVDLKNLCGSSKHCGRECSNTSVLQHRLVKTNCYIMTVSAYRSYQVFTAVADQMTVVFAFSQSVVVKCSDISEEHTASIFRVTELVQVDAADTQGRNVLDV